MTTLAASDDPRPQFLRGAAGILVVAAVFVAAGFLLPMIVTSRLSLSLVTQATLQALLAISVGFLFRQIGLTSFGQAGWFGLAAYTVAVNGRFGFVDPEVAVVLALVVPTLLAVLLGTVIVRLPHLAFSMLTLAVAQAVHEVFLKWRDLANGDDGMEVRLPRRLFGFDVEIFQQPQTMVVIAWVALVVVVAGLALFARSHLGLLTRGIRDNEERARYIGYETLKPRVVVYGLSAAVAAVAGVLFAFYNGFVTPGLLHWSLSGEVLIMAFIGGPRVIWGPVLGAALFFLLKNYAGDHTEHWQALIGVILMVVTILLPEGLAGLVGRIGRRIGRGRAA